MAMFYDDEPIPLFLWNPDNHVADKFTGERARYRALQKAHIQHAVHWCHHGFSPDQPAGALPSRTLHTCCQGSMNPNRISGPGVATNLSAYRCSHS